MLKRSQILKLNLIFTLALIISVSVFNINIVSASSVNLTVKVGERNYSITDSDVNITKDKITIKNPSEFLDKIYNENYLSPVNAKAKLNGDSFIYIKEKKGFKIDKVKLLSDITFALNYGYSEIKANKEDIFPKVTIEELKKCNEVISTFTTYYPNSSIERKHNIMLAVNSINGVQIDSGEEFSFNQTVGMRSEERGYKSAKVIMGGKYVEGIGGGVCQVSSTLYNAFLLAGLTPIERKAHTLPVSYVEPSFDAMVSSGYSDLKVKNERGTSVIVKAECDGNRIKITLFGKKDEYYYEREFLKLEEILPPENEIEYTYSLKKGERIVLIEGKSGYYSEGYLIKYKNGERVSSSIISRDKYLPVRGKMLIGK